ASRPARRRLVAAHGLPRLGRARGGQPRARSGRDGSVGTGRRPAGPGRAATRRCPYRRAHGAAGCRAQRSEPGRGGRAVRRHGTEGGAGPAAHAVVLRRLPMPDKPVVNGHAEAWSLGYAVDVVLTRDTWMHGIDTSSATGRAARLTPEHDGVLVADVVAEWAQRHAQPCRLHLAGPAGGAWAVGSGGPTLELDAVEFCRILSGPARATGLLPTPGPL